MSIWNENVLLVEDAFQADRVLAVTVCGAADGFCWAFANVYGPNIQSDRTEFLDLLSNVKSR